MTGATWRAVAAAIEEAGLAPRGVVSAQPQDAALPEGVRALVLVGFAGRSGWEAFARAPEATDGAPHPLDRWSRRILDGLATALGAKALYPFGGPPHWPFQRWALATGQVFASPLGLLVDPEFGLWHSYRGALGFMRIDGAPEPAERQSPCERCAEKPCLKACPVGAFSASGYDVAACYDHLETPVGHACFSGCLARRACPVGALHRQSEAQAHFHMQAFFKARPR